MNNKPVILLRTIEKNFSSEITEDSARIIERTENKEIVTTIHARIERIERTEKITEKINQQT